MIFPWKSFSFLIVNKQHYTLTFTVQIVLCRMGKKFFLLHDIARVDLVGGCRGMCTPPSLDKAFFVFAFKICFPHQFITPFLSGAPHPNKNPGSPPPPQCISDKALCWCCCCFISFINTCNVLRFWLRQWMCTLNKSEHSTFHQPLLSFSHMIFCCKYINMYITLVKI